MKATLLREIFHYYTPSGGKQFIERETGEGALNS